MATTKKATALTETGYVNGAGLNWQQWDQDEKVPELQWPNSNAIYARMTREDGRVSSVLKAIGLPVRRTPWRIDPNGASDQVTEHVSRDLGLPIVGQDVAEMVTTRSRGRFSWPEHLQLALLMLQYGHSFFEQVYRLGDDNLLHLHKLAARPQRTISKINVARDGGLESITQSPPVSTGRLLYAPTDIEVPVDRLVAYVLDPEPGQWSGNSLLRPAYKHWLLKDELIRIQAATARRNGMGVPVVTTSSDDQDQVRTAREIASGFRGGNTSGVGLPLGWEMQLLGVQGNLPDIQRAIEYHDKQIALAGLAHFLNLDRGGSYALASVQADTFVQSVQTFAESIANVATAHIVEDLVDLNWGEDEPAPRIVFDEIGTRQDATAAAMKMLVEAGLLDPDDPLVRRTIRQQVGLPPIDVDEEPTAPAPTPVAARAKAKPTQESLW